LGLEACCVPVLARVGAACECVAVDEDRVPGAEVVDVVADDEVEPEPVELIRSAREGRLDQERVTVDTEARSVERGLRVELVVDEGGDELEMRLSLEEAAHHAERAEQAAVSHQQTRDDGVVGTPAGLHVAGNGEAGAPILEDDARPRCDETRAEAVEEALDERDGGALAVDRTQVDGPAGRLLNQAGSLPPSCREPLFVEQPGDVGAVADGEERVLERELYAAHLRAEIGLAE